MKRLFIAFLSVMIIALLFTGCAENSSSSNGKYGYGDNYDKNVNNAADAYGENPDDVNDAINRVVNEANN